jgi:predicted permease
LEKVRELFRLSDLCAASHRVVFGILLKYSVMYSMTGVIISAIIPTFLIIGTGIILRRTSEIEAGPLNTLSLIVLAPALTVHSITLAALSPEALLKISIGVCMFIAAALVASWVTGKALGKDGATLQAFLLVAAFGNTGALGIPLADFAFGDIGRQTAVLFAAIHGAVVFTVGFFIAANSSDQSSLDSLKQILRYPLIYAVSIAVVARFTNAVPAADSPVMETLGLVGESAIPIMLIVLGIQLADTEYRTTASTTLSPMIFRFTVSPAIGLLVALGLGFQNTTVTQVFVLLTAMPVAVAPVIFVTEFAPDAVVNDVTLPEYISTNVLMSTLASILVLTGLVAVLQAGLIV